MLRAPLPAPIAALNRLLFEPAKNIMHRLSDASDLLHLRHTCRVYRSYTVLALRPLLVQRLKQLRVLMTEDGLRMLLELLSTPE
jgi:hypothetical protein